MARTFAADFVQRGYYSFCLIFCLRHHRIMVFIYLRDGRADNLLRDFGNDLIACPGEAKVVFATALILTPQTGRMPSKPFDLLGIYYEKVIIISGCISVVSYKSSIDNINV